MTIGTRIHTFLFGKKVGQDEFGNIYYTEKRMAKNRRTKRWVIYYGDAEATRVPPDWHGWLHYTVDAPPPSTGLVTRKPWIRPHQANQSGTPNAYLPHGHLLKGDTRAKATGDYEPWTPV
ncbi:MAG: NADH:ubiquinone oxidoreductase subunit NDUFA12 [Alphaproteobacteria bacterium]|nr:MAG: NADH:ubiquinone oxidoreductase subunit NDUFA12 [Alphaproteobacteria bacterium]